MWVLGLLFVVVGLLGRFRLMILVIVLVSIVRCWLVCFSIIVIDGLLVICLGRLMCWCRFISGVGLSVCLSWFIM